MGYARPVVLCVDDEPRILEVLALQLRPRFEVLTAAGGAEGLGILDARPGVAVVMSDLRMPDMDGAAFLHEVSERHPSAVRVLLTGYGDLTAAITAVNEGQIFRFLTKPYRAPDLLRALDDAAEQHRLITAERVLLEQTLQGSIKALVDVLALANPASFGHASRVKGLVTRLADHLGLRARWQVEVAALLAPLGCITLPSHTQQALLTGQPLGDEEAAMVRRIPSVTDALLRNVPRLENVRAMIAAAVDGALETWSGAGSSEVTRGAGVLRAADDFDMMVARGDTPVLALETMRSRAGRYPAEVMKALAAIIQPAAEGAPGFVEPVLREVPMAGLGVGMVLAEDLKTDDGLLLATRGCEVTVGLVERAANLSDAESRRQTVRVVLRPGTDSEVAGRRAAVVTNAGLERPGELDPTGGGTTQAPGEY